MLVTKKHKKTKIISLSVLYSIVFFSIVLAFPDTTDSVSYQNSLFKSANTVATIDFPVQFLGTSENSGTPPSQNTSTNLITPSSNNNTSISSPNSASTTTTTTPPVSNPAPKPTVSITCASVQICDKVKFSDTYTNRQKSTYYSSIIDILYGLQNHLTNGKNISDTLFSISLISTAGERRGRGGSKTITIHTKDIKTTQEFREIFTHELGHIIDLGVIKGNSSSLDYSFLLGNNTQFSIDDRSLDFYKISWQNTTTRKAEAGYLDFVGGYAMSSPYEDFAETFNAFLWHNDTLKTMAQKSPALAKKYSFMNNLLQGFFFSNDTVSSNRSKKEPGRRPWDTTRMSLE